MPEPRRTAAVVLAAGSASRFGSAKILALLDGRPLLVHVVTAARTASISDVVVVLGPDTTLEPGADFGDLRVVRNEEPGRGLSSSLRIGLEALHPATDGALILLGDQPLVRPEVIAAILGTDVPPGRSIVVPRYRGGGGPNPALLLRAAWPLAAGLAGDRGLGPIIAAHPEIAVRVPVEGTNPDVDTTGDLALVAWASRVRANEAQVERFREVGDGDFYACTTRFFQADPRRTDAEDPVLANLRALARPGERWLDIGAGAGRYALPLALALRSAGEVIAIDPSPAMLEALVEGMTEHGIDNVRPIAGRWPLQNAEGLEGDVALIAHVGYDIEAFGAFLEAMEAAVSRLCVAVMMQRSPASVAEPFWPPVHGEPRIPLPALPEFVDLLKALGREPSVTIADRDRRTFPDHDAALALLRRQTWVAPGGAKDLRLQALLDERLVARPDGSLTIRDAPELVAGVVTWEPQRKAVG